MNSLITLQQDALERCEVTQEKFDKKIEVLTKYIGDSILDSIRKEMSLSTINKVFKCANLLEILSVKVGFNRVIKEIARCPFASLHEPKGQWFQLLVAYILHKIGEDFVFEQDVQGIKGKPKDILLRSGSVIFECKSFDDIFTIQKIFSGEVPLQIGGTVRGFTKRFRTLNAFGISQPFGVDEYITFETNAVKEKIRQLVPGMCNVITFNPDRFANDPSTLREPLSQFLSNNQYELISAFLIVEEEQSADMKCRDILVRSWIITNPSPDAVQLPQDLVSKLGQS